MLYIIHIKCAYISQQRDRKACVTTLGNSNVHQVVTFILQLQGEITPQNCQNMHTDEQDHKTPDDGYNL